MSGHIILKVFVGFILFLSLVNVYRSREMIFPSVEYGLQMIIEHLTDLQTYVRQQPVEYIQSRFCVDDCKIKDDQSKSEEECPQHRYITRIIQRSPLIIYIEKFLTENETDHLIELAEPLFQRSMTVKDDGSFSLDQRRTSNSAYLGRHQTSIVKCLEQRFAQFQGNVDPEHVEPLQVVKYTDDQEFKYHCDWLTHPDLLSNGGQRITTFFSYLQSNCSKGETEFVSIRFNKTLHERFCDILNCDDESSEHGIRFRPLAGNSIFWYNMDKDGQVDYLTDHAGHPPGPNGQKIGLNTWTRIDTFYWPPTNN